jgi:hypothetical protein
MARRAQHRAGRRLGLPVRLRLHNLAAVLRSGLPLKTTITVALIADTVSILTMKIADNAIMLAGPTAMDASLTTGLFWGAWPSR